MTPATARRLATSTSEADRKELAADLHVPIGIVGPLTHEELSARPELTDVQRAAVDGVLRPTPCRAAYSRHLPADVVCRSPILPIRR